MLLALLWQTEIHTKSIKWSWVLQKETIFDLVPCSCRKLCDIHYFLSEVQLLRAVSWLQPWSFMGTHNHVVSIIMKIYSKLVKVKVEPCTLRRRIRNWACQDLMCNVMSPEDTHGDRSLFFFSNRPFKPMKTCPCTNLKQSVLVCNNGGEKMRDPSENGLRVWS